MSTSALGGRVRGPALVAGDPIPAIVARDRIINAAHHYADMRCNHLVTFSSPAAALIGANTGYLVPNPVATDYGRVEVWGPFPITLHADRRPYRIRIRLAGAASVGGTQCDFGVVITPTLSIGTEYIEDTAIIDGVGATYSTTSATVAELTNVSGLAYFDLAQQIADNGWGRRATLTDTGGTPTEVETCEVYVQLYAKSANPGVASPRCHALHVSEYVGV